MQQLAPFLAWQGKIGRAEVRRFLNEAVMKEESLINMEGGWGGGNKYCKVHHLPPPARRYVPGESLSISLGRP